MMLKLSFILTETTPLEKVMIWIFTYGQWDGPQTIREEVIGLLVKQRLNLHSLDHLEILECLIKSIIGKLFMESLKDCILIINNF